MRRNATLKKKTRSGGENSYTENLSKSRWRCYTMVCTPLFWDRHSRKKNILPPAWRRHMRYKEGRGAGCCWRHQSLEGISKSRGWMLDPSQMICYEHSFSLFFLGPLLPGFQSWACKKKYYSSNLRKLLTTTKKFQGLFSLEVAIYKS